MNHNLQPIPKRMVHRPPNAIPHPLSLPLPSLTNLHYTVPIPHAEIPSAILNDIPLPPEYKNRHSVNAIYPMQFPIIPPSIPGLPLYPAIPPIPPIRNMYIPRNIPLIPPIPYLQNIPMPLSNNNTSNLRNHNQRTTKRKRKRLPKPSNSLIIAPVLSPPPLIELNRTQSTTEHTEIDSLPLGHPGRIKFIDMVSEAFSEKNKHHKRSVTHRTWARARKCRDCGTTYPSTDDYDLHRMVYHCEGLHIDHACPICGTGYKERRWLNRHVRNAHFKLVCKIDGNGINQSSFNNAELKKRKGVDSICGYRFSEAIHLEAHQAIVHGIQNGYEGEGPTIQFMNGTDTKNIVIKRLESKDTDDKENGDEDDDDLIDLSDITMMLKGNNVNGKKKKRRKEGSGMKSTKKNSRKKDKKSKKSKSPQKTKRKLVGGLEEEPVSKKQKLNEYENETNSNL